MKHTRGLAIILLLVLLVIPACNFPLFDQGEVTNPPVVKPTTAQVPVVDAPTVQVTEQLTEQPTAGSTDEPLLPTHVDDFSDPDSGWSNGSDENGIYAYENGRYHVTETKADWITWQYYGTNISDVIVEVDAMFNSSVHQSVGVFCRMMDKDNYYTLEITSTGEFMIRMRLNGKWTSLVKRQMQTGNVIKTGNGAWNKIQGGCIGSQLVLVVNGQQIAQVTTANDLSNGDVGIASGTFEDPGGDTYYDNFTMYSMQPSGGASVPDIPIQPTVSSSGGDPKLLYSDDFSQDTGLWDTWQDDTGVARFDQGRFYIQVAKPENLEYSLLDKDFTDTGVEVDTTIASSAEIGLGIICRYQDSKNYYLFYISYNQKAGIWKVKDGKQVAIQTVTDPNPILKSGKGAVNQLQAGCVGDHLFFYANGQLLGEGRDSDFTSGHVGIFNGTYSQPNAEAYFDNFNVLAP